MNGYILTAKKILESDIWNKPPLYLKVWLYLLCKAQYQPYKDLKRSQLVTSIPEIRDACTYYAGYRKEKPSKKQIADILDYLRNPYEGNDGGNAKDSMIVTTKVTHGMLVTICNFNVYQDSKNYGGNDGGNNEKSMEVARRSRQGANINKEDIKRIIPPYPLDDFAYSPALREQVEKWLTYKAERKDSYTPTGIKTLLNRIQKESELHGDTIVIELIEDSISNQWKGIVWDKLKAGNPKSTLQTVIIPDGWKG